MPNCNPPKEDAWAFQPIGSPFPDNPVKVYQQQNQYVALWYKNGKAVHSRAWNNGGVVECSFPYVLGAQKVELTGAKDLAGQIQVLQYKGDHRSLGFWYNWIKYSQRFEKDDVRQLVKCGDSLPILWNRPEGALLGFLDNKTEIASFSHDKQVTQKQGLELNDMMIIVRELKEGPPGCDCPDCCKLPPKPVIRVMLNEWADFKEGDDWPTRKMVQALGKSLDTVAGEDPNQYIALWYQAGEPVMGRVMNKGGKISCVFGWNGHEFKDKCGSIQILYELSEHVRGFDYSWQPYAEAAKFGEKEWHPVHVNHHKGDISPGVITIDGKQILGKVDVRNEKASAAFGGKEHVLVGGAVHTAVILCRKAKPGCKFD